MKKIKILSDIFGVLAICGAVYVFYTGGRASAGFAVIPALFKILFSERKSKPE